MKDRIRGPPQQENEMLGLLGFVGAVTALAFLLDSGELTDFVCDVLGWLGL